MTDEAIRTIWRCCSAVVIALSVVIASCDAYSTKRYTEAGYTRCTLPGASEAMWCKP